MKAKLALLGAAAAATLSVAALAGPAHAQRYYSGFGRTVERCNSYGDRCATYRCDVYGDDCYRVSGWYARSRLYAPRYRVSRYYDEDGYLTVRRCNLWNDNCVYFRCDENGDDCRRI